MRPGSGDRCSAPIDGGCFNGRRRPLTIVDARRVDPGFATFEELQQASTEAPSNDGHRWFLTQLKDNAWIDWVEKELDVERHYATREEALASVPH